MMRRASILVGIALALLAGCAGEQSALTAAGAESGRTLLLTWILTIGSVAIFVLVLAALAIALVGPRGLRERLSAQRLVVHGGITFPVVVLGALLIYGFAALNAGPPVGSDDDTLHIRVEGKQWWWRVTYLGEDGSAVETANELRLPVGRTVEIELTSADVIHSFWVPAYAGKVDMIPGRTNRITLVANEPGVVRGQCAEYCGGAHALMAFQVVSQPAEDFDSWLSSEAAPAQIASTDGAEAFLNAGCGACHAVRGTPAMGTAGPDLTHVASRRTIGAGIMPTDRAAFLEWIEHHPDIKPRNLMPSYDFLSDEERAAIADFLAGLE